MTTSHLLSLLLLASAICAATTADAAEIAQYNFNGNVTDSIGGYNATAQPGSGSISYVTDRFGQTNGAVVVTGNAEITVANDTLAGSSATISVWAKGPIGNGVMLFNMGPDGSGPDLYFYSNQISWNTWNGDFNAFGNSGTPVTIPSSAATGFHNYTVVLNGTNATLYYDGTMMGAANYVAPTSSLVIGNAGVDSYAWGTAIDQLTLWNSALTSTQVASFVSSGSAVPEPASVLVALGGAAIAWRGRRVARA